MTENNDNSLSTAPQTPTEKKLVQIYTSIIGVSELTTESRFLDIGGNSLNLVEVLLQIENQTGTKLNPRSFFERDTSKLGNLAKLIDSSKVPT